jgi:hypothetical protein
MTMHAAYEWGSSMDRHVWLEQPISKVNELVFTASCIPFSFLARIVKSIEALEIFCYEFAYIEGSDGMYDGQAIIDVLAQHAGHSLKGLKLEKGGYGSPVSLSYGQL